MFLLLACVDKLPPPAEDGTVPLSDENNFSFTGTIDAPSFSLAEYQDVGLSWANLADDLRCHDLDPVADIDNTALIAFPYLTEEEVEAGLGDESLEQVDMGVYLSYLPGDNTSVTLTQLTFFGTDADIETYFYEGNGSWLITLNTGTAVAVGARMLAFLTPTAGETATMGDVTDACSVLDFSADVTSLTRVPVLTDGPWYVDWSLVTKNGHGGEFTQTRADSLMIARFDESVAELEANFLDLDLLAEETWTYPLYGGVTADLDEMSGGEFPGFAKEGTWVLALLCSTCPTPAPLFLTVLEPG